MMRNMIMMMMLIKRIMLRVLMESRSNLVEFGRGSPAIPGGFHGGPRLLPVFVMFEEGLEGAPLLQ